jgi:molybdopterin-guanine dinucleotide biosynthesis protein A
MKHSCSGVILSGGLNTRFSGERKTLVKIAGKTILYHICSILRDVFDELILIADDPAEYLAYDLKIITDVYAVRSSLTGIHSALTFASNRNVFITACDTPFIKKELVELVVAGADEKTDVVLPETRKGIEPLFAVYSKQCLKPLEECLRNETLKIKLAIQNLRVKNIPEDVLRQKDPELVSFFNVNTLEDLKTAEKMLKEGRA